jgi:hypothetical protein
MKRFVLLLVCAAVFVCLLAAPAADAKKKANRQTYRPPVDATMMWGPWWFEYSGDTGTFSDVSWHQAGDPNDPDFSDLYKSVPIENDTYLWSQWAGVNYGFMRNVPNSLLFTVDISGPEGFEQHISPDEAKAYWTGPHIWDQFWADFWYDSYGFNLEPNKDLGALFYDQNLMLPIGPFPIAGRYEVHVLLVTVRPLNELIWHGVPRHTATGGFGYEYTFSMDVD